jgi:hypothetical protein
VISRVFIITIASFVGVLLFVAVLLRPLPVGERSERRLRWWRIFRVAVFITLLSIVTTGIGTSIMRVRFRVPPEIVILTVTS